MKCPFCPKELRIAARYENHESCACDCGDCNTYFYIELPERKITSYGIHFFYKDKKYSIYFRTREIDGPKFELSGTTSDSSKGIITILTLDFHPAITPHNVLKKLPTLLVWS